MKEPRWVRPLARVYLILASALWVTWSGFELARAIVGGQCEVTGAKGTVLPLCAAVLPMWAAAIVGLVGVLAAYLAARLTRPRSV